MQHDLLLPLEQLWFSLPAYIHRKNIQRNPDETGFTMRLKPFLGMILFVHEGERIPWAWWKKIVVPSWPFRRIR